MNQTVSPNQVYDQIGLMVDEGMINLKNLMEQYVSPTLTTKKGAPKTGITALAEDIGVSRSNIAQIFSEKNAQEMSTWLFVKIAQHLDLWPEGWQYAPDKRMEKQSIKIAMITPRDPLMVVLARLLSE